MCWTPEDEVTLNKLLERKKCNERRLAVIQMAKKLENTIERFKKIPDAFEIEVTDQFEDTDLHLMGRPVGSPTLIGRVYVIKERIR